MYKAAGLKYWENVDWISSGACAQNADNATKPRGKKPGENVRELYIEDASGNPVSGTRAEAIRATCQSLFQELLRKGLAPSTWDRVAGADVKLWLVSHLVVACPEMGYCQDSYWKANYLATQLYSNWTRTRRHLLQAQNGGADVKVEESDGNSVILKEEGEEANMKRKVSEEEANTKRKVSEELPTATLPKKLRLSESIDDSDNDKNSSASSSDPALLNNVVSIPTSEEIPAVVNTMFTRKIVTTTTDGDAVVSQSTDSESTRALPVLPDQPVPAPSSMTASVHNQEHQDSANPRAQSPVQATIATVPGILPNAAVSQAPTSTTIRKPYKPDPKSTTPRGLCALDWVKVNPGGSAEEYDGYWQSVLKEKPDIHAYWKQKSDCARTSKATAAQGGLNRRQVSATQKTTKK